MSEHRHSWTCVAVLLALAWCAASAEAGTAQTPGVDSGAAKMVSDVVHTYVTARTYVEAGTVTEGPPGGHLSRTSYKIVYQAPNLLLAWGGGVSGKHLVACDGHSIYLLRRPFDNMARGPAPARLRGNPNLWEVFATPDIPDEGLNFIDCLSGDFTADRLRLAHLGLPQGDHWLASLAAPKGTIAVTLASNQPGRPGQVVVWIDTKHHVVRQWASVSTVPGGGGWHWVATATRVSIDGRIPAKIFAYKVPAGMTVLQCAGLGSMMGALAVTP